MTTQVDMFAAPVATVAPAPIKRTSAKAGPRQTVDACVHPTLGPGLAVYDNGPAFFEADSGEVVQFKKIGFGGCSGSRTYLRARADGDEVELDTTKLAAGDRHRRIVSQLGGPGWLVDLAEHPPRRARYRFDPDSGSAPVEMLVTDMHVGTPAEYKAMSKAKGKDIKTPWMTLNGDSGSFIWRHEDAQ